MRNLISNLSLSGGLCLVAMLVSTGCDPQAGASDDIGSQSETERQPIGKADAFGGTCEARCGEYDPNESCQCDDACEQFGDCCADRGAVCEGEPSCDPGLICTQVVTCVDGELYPTGCGPANCDEPIGVCDDGGTGEIPCTDGTQPVCAALPPECADGLVPSVQNGCFGPCVDPQTCEEPTCDPSLICTQAITCVDGQLYPTGCGPANCDEPLGPCDDGGEPECDPTLICTQAITCVDGQFYPTGCGPANCDEPLGPCDGGGEPECDPTLICGQALTCVDGSLYPTTCGPANCDAPIGAC